MKNEVWWLRELKDHEKERWKGGNLKQKQRERKEKYIERQIICVGKE